MRLGLSIRRRAISGQNIIAIGFDRDSRLQSFVADFLDGSRTTGIWCKELDVGASTP